MEACGVLKEHSLHRENEKLEDHWLMGRDEDDHGKVQKETLVKNLECYCKKFDREKSVR